MNLNKFNDIIKGAARQTKMISKSSIKLKRRDLGKQNLNEIRADDYIIHSQ
jgi:hypothetical protein